MARRARAGTLHTQMRVFLIFELTEEIPLLRRSTGKGLSAAVHKPGTFPTVNSIHVPIWIVFLFTLLKIKLLYWHLWFNEELLTS